MEKSPYKKFYVVEADVYEKLKASNINETHLSSKEAEMLKILKNKNLPVEKRLKLYQMIMFQTMNQQQVNVKDETAKEEVKKPIITPSYAVATQTNRIVKNDFAVGDGNVHEKSDAEKVEKVDNSKKLQEIYASDEVDSSFDRTIQAEPKTRQLDEFIEDDERERIMNSINEEAPGSDIRDLVFNRSVHDPDATSFTVYNSKTNDTISVEKSKSLLTRQQARKKRENAEKLKAIMKSVERFRPQPQYGTGGFFIDWPSYETILKKRKLF